MVIMIIKGEFNNEVQVYCTAEYCVTKVYGETVQKIDSF